MTAMERAFQIARTGQASGLPELIASLRREGYATDQIQGPALRRQLTSLIRAARRHLEASP
jgi:hypothetical protein